MDASLVAAFEGYQDSLEKEQEKKEQIRQKVRLIELTNRNLQSVLLTVHAPNQAATETVAKAREHIPALVAQFAELQELIAEGDYYKYCDQWRNCTQRSAFLIAFIHYLENKALLSYEQFVAALQELDQLLLGLLNVASELSRLAVNCVTAGDYQGPKEISAFLNDMQVAFRMLNLKNDGLRKRFDSLKYDIKKVEEVIYDLSIRNLGKSE